MGGNWLGSLRDRYSRPALWLAGVLAFFLIAATIHVIAFVTLEGAPLGEALWATWQTFSTVGYEDRPVPGAATRIVVAFVSTGGVLAVGALLTGFIELREHKATSRRTGQLDNPQTAGYVIVNFPGEHLLETFVKEIRAVEPSIPVCVVDSSIDELPPNNASLPGMHFVRGPVIDRETYVRARVRDAKAVIVFPQRPFDPSSDGTTRTLVNLVHRASGPTTRIMHVLVSPKNYWLFEDAPSTTILGSFEILSLVQECQDPYSAPIVENLFRNSVGPRPLTVHVGEAEGITWAAFVHACLDEGAAVGAHMMPWALVRDGQPDLTPSPTLRLQRGDLVSMITNDKTTWDAFEPRVAERAKALDKA